MSLLVEDGSLVENAESYASVAFCDIYHSARAQSNWALLTTEQKEQMLRRATEYIDLRFWAQFSGLTTAAQALCFPRVGQTAVPLGVQRATAEYALRAAVAPLVPDPTVDAAGVAIKSKTEKLGPLEEKTEYANTTRETFTPYPAADLLLKPFLKRAGLVR